MVRLRTVDGFPTFLAKALTVQTDAVSGAVRIDAVDFVARASLVARETLAESVETISVS